jgi:hypothetical protein
MKMTGWQRSGALGVLVAVAVGLPALGAPPGAFQAGGNMAERRNYPEVTLLTNGKVLVTGGEGLRGTVTSGEVFDPTTNTFTPVGPINA